MKRGNPISGWMRHNRHRQWLLAEALFAIGVASAAVRLLPFNRAVRLGSRPLPEREWSNVASDACWAVEAVGRRVPWRAVCFQKGLALQWMLRRRGMDAMLHYGIAYDEQGQLQAHVWVAESNTILIGGAEAARFQRVATYP